MVTVLSNVAWTVLEKLSRTHHPEWFGTKYYHLESKFYPENGRAAKKRL
jgi:hypothetical protein